MITLSKAFLRPAILRANIDKTKKTETKRKYYHMTYRLIFVIYCQCLRQTLILVV